MSRRWGGDIRSVQRSYRILIKKIRRDSLRITPDLLDHIYAAEADFPVLFFLRYWKRIIPPTITIPMESVVMPG